MNVLVLGATGMAGHMVALYLRESGFHVDTLAAHGTLDKNTQLVDVFDARRLKQALDAKPYDAVINCIALLVSASQEQKDQAIYLNAYLPHLLESHFQDRKTKVVHISTDGVFSSKNPPVREDSPRDAEDFYGRSKALGELLNEKDLTFRLSIVGPALLKTNSALFNWILREHGTVKGYTNVIWHGITTLELAKAIKAALEQNLSGVYHLIPDKNISKFELLKLIKEVFELKDVEIEPTKGSELDKSLLNTRKDFDYQVPDYKTMLTQLRDWMKSHPEIYSHYED